MPTTVIQDAKIYTLLKKKIEKDLGGFDDSVLPDTYDFLADAIADIFTPDQLFEHERLEAWALANGFVKVRDIQEAIKEADETKQNYIDALSRNSPAMVLRELLTISRKAQSDRDKLVKP